TALASTAEKGAANTQVVPKVQARRGVQEILGGEAAIAGKETQPAAQVSVNAAKETVGVSRGKNGASASAAVIATGPAVNGKNGTPVGVNVEPVTPEIAVTPDKRGSTKSGSSIKGNSNAEAGASGNSDNAGSATTGKDLGLSTDPNAVHSAMPAGQSDPNNLAVSVATTVPAPSATVGKDLASAVPVKAGDTSNNAAP